MSRKQLISLDQYIAKNIVTDEDKALFEKIGKEVEIENMKEVLKEIAAELKKTRIEKGYSQSDLAKKLGTQKTNISRIESGRQNMSIELLYKMAVALDKKARIELY